jgi:hypothetical protein
VGIGDRYKPKIAPTWSWASTEAEVSYPKFGEPNSQCLAHVALIDMPSSESILFGKIPNGKGCLHINCSYLLRTVINSIKCPSTGVFLFDFYKEGFSIVELTSYVWMDNHQTTIGGSFYFLPLVYDIGSESIRTKIRGIFIRPTGSRRGEYERLGMFRNDRMFEVLDKIANNPSYCTGPEDFAEIQTDTDGKVNRIITLV